MKNPTLKSLLIFSLVVCVSYASFARYKTIDDKPLRVGVVGLVHAHVHQILSYKGGDIEIVGIAEPNRDLAERLCKQYNIPLNLVFNSVEEMVKTTKPEAVSGFNSTFDHLRLVQVCAPMGIHVMVEKPLAVNNDHAQQMVALAKKHNIHLLTNYETSWYGSNTKAYELVKEESKIGDIRRIVFHTGHPARLRLGVILSSLIG